MSTVPNLIEPPIGRQGGPFHLPPWPWELRRVGQEPEDFEAEGYAVYPGLEFSGVVEYPPHGICDFLVPSNWTFEGDLADGLFDHEHDPLLYPGEAGVHSYQYPVIEFTINDPVYKLGQMGSVPWDSLESVYELMCHDKPELISYFPSDKYIVSRGLTGAADAWSTTSSITLSVSAYGWVGIHAPECCKNELGEIVWRIKIAGQLYAEYQYWVVGGGMGDDGSRYTVIGTNTAITIDFVDSDYVSNNATFAGAEDRNITVTVTREPYTA